MKIPSIFLFVSIVFSCNYFGNKNQAAMYNALDFVLDSLITQRFSDNYSINNVFSLALDENYLRQDLEGLEEDLKSDGFLLSSLINQNNALKGTAIKEYISEKYHSKIIQDGGHPTLISLGVPLFNGERTKFIQYILFDYENGSWSHQYIEGSLIESQWELTAVLEIIRDEIEVKIEEK